jgi:hypothetical protein
MSIRVLNYANLSREAITAIESELAEQYALKDLMTWALADAGKKFIAGVVQEIVVQDEFTHDVIVPWGTELVLVYDTTCTGAITAVAVWNHLPSAKEILDARRKAGWSPRPSILKAGDRVVGHAACVVTDSLS